MGAETPPPLPSPAGAGEGARPPTDLMRSSAPMARLLIRHLDEDVKAGLQRRARRHGWSMEEEVREILRNAVRQEHKARTPLGSRLSARFARIGLTEDIPELRDQQDREQEGWG